MSEEIKKLIDGNVRFQSKYFGTDRTLFDELVLQGQRPKIMIIACSDSRVDPSTIFNCKPGSLFVVRNIANLIPPCENTDTYHGTSAALEFGVSILQVEHIIILGHTLCGGIRALLENDSELKNKKQSFIAKWMELASPARDAVMTYHAHAPFQEQAIACGQYALINSLHNLMSFPWINERVQAGNISVHAWYFDLETGGIYRYDRNTQSWAF